MSDFTITRAPGTPRRVLEWLSGAVRATAESWARAREAQRLAETYLSLSDEALAARGTTRAAVTGRITRVLTEGQ